MVREKGDADCFFFEGILFSLWDRMDRILLICVIRREFVIENPSITAKDIDGVVI